MATQAPYHYVSRNTNDHYCQYCLEGIATPADYKIVRASKGACVNCGGEHTPSDLDYSLRDCGFIVPTVDHVSTLVLYGYSIPEAETLVDTLSGIARSSFQLHKAIQALTSKARG